MSGRARENSRNEHLDSVRRFDDRAGNYERFRPDYPPQVVELLRRDAGLPAAGHVADIGSGTGKLSDVFLRAGYRVTGVEPNDAMRAAAERQFGGEGRFTSVAGTAEATLLPDRSVDAIVAGQAFHWFEPRAARVEFQRILRAGAGGDRGPDAAGGPVALIWNDRRTSDCPLHADYEALLLRHCPGYAAVQRGAPDEAALASFFSPAPMTELCCPNSQVVDWNGLLGRVLSASYVPLAGPEHEALVAGLRASFERHADDGRVALLYDTRMFAGRLGTRL